MDRATRIYVYFLKSVTPPKGIVARDAKVRQICRNIAILFSPCYDYHGVIVYNSITGVMYRWELNLCLTLGSIFTGEHPAVPPLHESVEGWDCLFMSNFSR